MIQACVYFVDYVVTTTVLIHAPIQQSVRSAFSLAKLVQRDGENEKYLAEN